MWVLVLLYATVNTSGGVEDIRPSQVPGFTGESACTSAGVRVRDDVRLANGSVWWGPRVTFSCVKL